MKDLDDESLAREAIASGLAGVGLRLGSDQGSR